jgi:GR25 family glycosyltransferase involved in LPS biosynthesis
MSFCHKVFHLDSDNERHAYTESINSYLADYSNELITPTIKISNQEEYESFIKNNSDFNIDPKGYNLDNIQGWRYGEVGIWASNFLALKAFIDSDNDYAILMEDDIIYDENYMTLLDKYIKELPLWWDMFSYFVPKDQKLKYNHESHDVGKDNVCKSYQDWSMLCYVVNKRSAKKILDFTKQGIRLPLDWFFYRQTNVFNCYTVKPYSTIGCTLAAIESTFQRKQERKILS